MSGGRSGKSGNSGNSGRSEKSGKSEKSVNSGASGASSHSQGTEAREWKNTRDSPAREKKDTGGGSAWERRPTEPTVRFGSKAVSIPKPMETVRKTAEVDTAAQPAVEVPPEKPETPAGPPILQVENIHVYYGSIHAIKGISFEVREGEIVTLIGANGAGKSTTLNTVAGLLRSRAGSVSFLGESLARVPCHKVVSRGLALVPEGRRIFLQMSVRENLEMGAYTQSPAGIGGDLEKVYHYFPRLREREGQIAGTLSGGEQQMLAMGRALMSHPKLLMLDEPSMGLAPILVEQIFEIIRNLHDAGSTILLVEQNARAALSIADRGYVLETGKIVTSGRGRDLLASPEIKKAYLGG